MIRNCHSWWVRSCLVSQNRGKEKFWYFSDYVPCISWVLLFHILSFFCMSSALRLWFVHFSEMIWIWAVPIVFLLCFSVLPSSESEPAEDSGLNNYESSISTSFNMSYGCTRSRRDLCLQISRIFCSFAWPMSVSYYLDSLIIYWQYFWGCECLWVHWLLLAFGSTSLTFMKFRIVKIRIYPNIS